VDVAGDKNDLYVCAPTSLGAATACTPGFTLIPAERVAAAQAEPAAGQALHLPLVTAP
jgi:hypothetical protein